jgi:4,5-dihydroxyphthalate decarboxylase
MAHQVSRRAAMAAVAGASAGLVAAQTAQAAPDDLPVSFACRLYDRMLPLYTGAVTVPGVKLNFLPNADHRQVFDRMENGLEFDVSEFSFSDYITLMGRGGEMPFVALPVFSSRVFRHGFIFTNRKSGITSPKDFEGKRVGIARWGETAVIWCRGMLQDEYGVDLSKVQWVTGALNRPGVHGAAPAAPPLKSFSIEANTSDKSLSQMLESGDVVATLGAELPASLGRNPDVVRLFPNYRELEKDWYRRTKLHPIMHVIAMRKDVHQRHPWLATNLTQAMQAAKLKAIADMQFTASLLYMQPWLQSDVEEMHAVFGGDAFPYGLEANRPSIEAAIRYSIEQGLIAGPMRPEDLLLPIQV